MAPMGHVFLQVSWSAIPAALAGFAHMRVVA